MTLKPSLYLAFSLSLLALPVQAKPACWQVVPGPTPDPALVAWWHGGKKLLETPAAWDVARAYQELQSYGYCSKTGERSSSQPTTAATEPVREVRSSTEIIKERRDQYEAQKNNSDTPNSLGDLIFLGGLVAAIFIGLKGSKNDLLETPEQSARRFFSSGVTEPSPWLADQVAPTRSGTPDMDAGDHTPAPAYTPTPKHTQGCGQSVSQVWAKCESGVDPGVGEVWKLSTEEARTQFYADQPFPAHDIDSEETLVKAVIRVGLWAGLKKADVMQAFYWMRKENEDTWKHAPITKGTNNKYLKFSELFDEVVYQEKQRRQQP